MTLNRKVLAASALAVFIGLPISAVLADSSSPMSDSGSAASAPAQGASIDDATLQKAAKAYVKVKQIVHQEKQANAAEPPQASDQSAKMAAVKAEGLDPQEYNQVLQTVQNDPQLQEKFAGYVNQNGGDSD
jgi:hypothetical protein